MWCSTTRTFILLISMTLRRNSMVSAYNVIPTLPTNSGNMPFFPAIIASYISISTAITVILFPLGLLVLSPTHFLPHCLYSSLLHGFSHLPSVLGVLNGTLYAATSGGSFNFNFANSRKISSVLSFGFFSGKASLSLA